jgi:hypothetical protein
MEDVPTAESSLFDVNLDWVLGAANDRFARHGMERFQVRMLALKVCSLFGFAGIFFARALLTTWKALAIAVVCIAVAPAIACAPGRAGVDGRVRATIADALVYDYLAGNLAPPPDLASSGPEGRAFDAGVGRAPARESLRGPASSAVFTLPEFVLDPLKPRWRARLDGKSDCKNGDRSRRDRASCRDAPEAGKYLRAR